MAANSSPNDVVKVQLPEVIDERLDLALVVGKTHPKMELNCSNLKRINSVGIRNFKATLNRVRIEGGHITFVGVTPPLMEAMDFVSNLVPPEASIESVYLPYCCTACAHAFQELQPYAGIEDRQEELETSVCPKCGKIAEFDNIPEIYFKKR